MIYFVSLFLGYIAGKSIDSWQLSKEYRKGFKRGIESATYIAREAVNELKIQASEAQLMETREAFKTTLFVDFIVDINK